MCEHLSGLICLCTSAVVVFVDVVFTSGVTGVLGSPGRSNEVHPSKSFWRGMYRA